MIPVIEKDITVELLAVTSLACGLVAIGTCNGAVSDAIVTKLLEANEREALKSVYMRLVVLGKVLNIFLKLMKKV